MYVYPYKMLYTVLKFIMFLTLYADLDICMYVLYIYKLFNNTT